MKIMPDKKDIDKRVPCFGVSCYQCVFFVKPLFCNYIYEQNSIGDLKPASIEYRKHIYKKYMFKIMLE